jgi:putative ABC transport system ATP-binding protein
MSLLQLNAVTRNYRTEDVETAALAGVDLRIDAGEFVAVMGPSGCGKSTLLNIVGMLDRPDSGELLFEGRDVARARDDALSALRMRALGFIFQSFNLIEELSVFENIELALLYRGVAAAERSRRVKAVMDRVGVAHRARHRPSQLSGGQQQRVAVARALVGEPRLILADEPTGNLDSTHGTEVMEMLRVLNREGATILMVTHSAEHSLYATRLVHMRDGRVLAEHRNAALHGPQHAAEASAADV